MNDSHNPARSSDLPDDTRLDPEEIEQRRTGEIFLAMASHVRRARSEESLGRVGFMPLGRRLFAPGHRPAPDEGEGAVMKTRGGAQAVFAPEGPLERVTAILKSGERLPLDLPSVAPYRDMSDITPDGNFLAVCSHTRAWAVDLVRGRQTLAMEGPWMTDAACLEGGYMVILTLGGTRRLDLADPDVRELSSVRDTGLTGASVTVECFPLLHFLDMKGPTKFLHSVRCRAESMETVLGGRVLVLRRFPRNSDEWGTVLVGCQGGKLAVLARYPRNIGRVFKAGEEVLAERGFRLLGLEGALAGSVPSVIRMIGDGLSPDPPPELPAAEIGSISGRVRLALRAGEPDMDRLPPGTMAMLGLGDGDWVPEEHSRGIFPILRRQGERYRLSIGRTDGESVTEVVPDFALEADDFSIGTSPCGSTLLASSLGGNFLADTETGHTEQVSPQNRHPLGAEVVDGDTFMVLSRIDPENCQLDVWSRLVEGWCLKSSLPTGPLDRLIYIHELRLVLLTFSNMPAERSLTMVMELTGELHLLPVDVIRRKVRRAGALERDRKILQMDDGSWYGLSVGGVVTEPPPGYLDYLPPEEGSPPGILLRKPDHRQPCFGYIDLRGRPAVSPSFTSATGFAAGNAVAGIPPHGFRGIIDTSGSFILPAHASWIGEPSEGFRRVAYAGHVSSCEPRDALYGMVDGKGEFLLQPRFSMLRDMAEGRAVVRYADGGENWVTESGRRLTGESYTSCGDFSQGLALAGRDGRFGFLDTGGNMVLDLRFSAALGFSCGLAGVKLQGNEWRCVDREGRVVSTRGYHEFYPHSDGYAAVRRDRTWGYIDERGEEPFGMDFQRTYDFICGLGVVVRDGRWNFLTRDGRMVSRKGWDGAFAPSEGLASYRQNGGFGFVDRDGETVTGPIFDSVLSFSEGMCAVEKGGRWGFIDTRGEMVIDPVFARSMNFSQGLAPAKLDADGPWGYIDVTGAFAIEPVFSRAFVFSGGYAVVGVGSYSSIAS